MTILQELFLIFSAIGLMFFGMILSYSSAKETFYKKGQIDAINGNIKYKLVEFEDGERQYCHVDELKDVAPHKIIN